MVVVVRAGVVLLQEVSPVDLLAMRQLEESWQALRAVLLPVLLLVLSVQMVVHKQPLVLLQESHVITNPQEAAGKATTVLFVPTSCAKG